MNNTWGDDKLTSYGNLTLSLDNLERVLFSGLH